MGSSIPPVPTSPGTTIPTPSPTSSATPSPSALVLQFEAAITECRDFLAQSTTVLQTSPPSSVASIVAPFFPATRSAIDEYREASFELSRLLRKMFDGGVRKLIRRHASVRYLEQLQADTITSDLVFAKALEAIEADRPNFTQTTVLNSRVRTLLQAMEQRLSEVRELESSQLNLRAAIPILSQGFRARLNWFFPSSSALITMAAGLCLLALLSSAQSSADNADIQDHLQLADVAANMASKQLEKIAPGLLGFAARHGQKSTKDTTFTQDLLHIAHDLTSADHLIAAGLDALSQAQHSGHAVGSAFASALSPALNRALGDAEQTRDAAQRFVNSAMAMSAKKEQPIVDTLLAAPLRYYSAIRSEVDDVCDAVAMGIEPVAVCSQKELPSSAVVKGARSRAHRPIWIAIMQNRLSFGFISKFAFAIAFLMVGGGVLLFVAQQFNLTDSKTIANILETATTTGVKASLGAWPLLAPIGLAAGLWLAPTDKTSDRKSDNNGSHVSTTPDIDPKKPAVPTKPDSLKADTTILVRIDMELKSMQGVLEDLKHRVP